MNTKKMIQILIGACLLVLLLQPSNVYGQQHKSSVGITFTTQDTTTSDEKEKPEMSDSSQVSPSQQPLFPKTGESVFLGEVLGILVLITFMYCKTKIKERSNNEI